MLKSLVPFKYTEISKMKRKDMDTKMKETGLSVQNVMLVGFSLIIWGWQNGMFYKLKAYRSFVFLLMQGRIPILLNAICLDCCIVCCAFWGDKNPCQLYQVLMVYRVRAVGLCVGVSNVLCQSCASVSHSTYCANICVRPTIIIHPTPHTSLPQPPTPQCHRP